MYSSLKGKKLLFLGAIRALCEPIKVAKEMGVYTIAIDYLPDSPAKKVADEAHLISTTDVDAVVEFCKKEGVDGVFTAFTDSMLPYARKICDILNLPFYASEEQIRLSLDKRYFKEMCRKSGVPVPYDYSCEIKEKGINAVEFNYPVIVKPIDSSGGRGIRICNNREQLELAYENALSYSKEKIVLVEEYVIGQELTATYTMKNGKAVLSCVKDKLISEDHDDITSQSDALVIPSLHTEQYINTVDQSVKQMLKNVGATDGTIFLQGIVNGTGFRFFECGYRINGACDYRHIERENGTNYLKMMIAHALTGDMIGFDEELENPRFKKFVITYNMWAHGGKIGFQSGLEDVLEIENVSFAEYMHEVGEQLVDNNTLSQRAFRAIIMDSSIEGVKKTIKKIQSCVVINDENNRNMLYKPFDVSRLDIKE